jgi:hypothetical protein
LISKKLTILDHAEDRYSELFENCIKRLTALLESSFYETMTREALVASIMNFGLYIRDNESVSKKAVEKLSLISFSLRRYFDDCQSVNRKPYEKLIINALEIIHVSTHAWYTRRGYSFVFL